MSIMNYKEAIIDALCQEMRADSTVFFAGEDVARKNPALLGEFGPKRVKGTPISEAQIVSLAVGAAAMGLRPVVQMFYMDLLGCAMDEIINQAAKMTFMLGGQTRLPMVVHAQLGAGIRAAAQHSQSLEAIFAHIPGLKVVVPSTPRKAKGLYAQAIRDNNPVLFLEHKCLGGLEEEVPDGLFALPFGKVDVVREGTDVSLVSWGKTVHTCLETADALERDGVSAEVVDVVSLCPFDAEGVLSSVQKTGRVVVAHEAVLQGGFGGEVAATIADKGFDFLKKPIKRVGAPFAPVPFSPVLEDAYIPNAALILKAVGEIL